MAVASDSDRTAMILNPNAPDCAAKTPPVVSHKRVVARVRFSVISTFRCILRQSMIR